MKDLKKISDANSKATREWTIMEIWKNLKTYLKIFGSLIIFKSFDTSQMWTNIQRICRFCGLMSAIFFGSKINMLNMFSRFWTVESFKRLPGSFWHLIWRILWIGCLRIHLWNWEKYFPISSRFVYFFWAVRGCVITWTRVSP